MLALLCRDHRGVVETMVAAATLGVRLVLMNTGFSGPQFADVAAGEGVSALVFDAEFAEVAAGLPGSVRRYVAWPEPGVDGVTLDELIAANSPEPMPAPAAPGGLVLLTSGTTGTPRGAPRRIRSPLVAVQFLDRVPLRAGEATFVAAPTFHGTGLSQFILSLALGRGVPPPVRRAGHARRRRRASLYRVGPGADDAPAAPRSRPGGAGRVRHVEPADRAQRGLAASAELGERARLAFGDVLHNLYGFTEVAVAAVATPADLRAAPGTVGRPPLGCHVRLFNRLNNEVGKGLTRAGERGRIFAGSSLAFGGYSGGGGKEGIDGLLSSGDVGHSDSGGRLFVDGRDDDMIVSGGENVFPGEIEDLPAGHEHVLEAAVVGVPDPEFGQRLRAFVVPDAESPADADALKAYVKANLARYKVPRDVVFVGELPCNATGKLLRRRLQEATPEIQEGGHRQ